MRRGFTLLEMMISIMLILALLAALFGFFFDALHSRARVMELTARHRAAAALIDRLERDLVFSLVGDNMFGAGVAGDATSIRILTRGVPIGLAERGMDDPNIFADLQRAEYRFQSSSGEIEARRGNAHESAGAFHPFGARLHRVEFRYHNGVRWVAQYDSFEANALPVAVEVAIWFESTGEEEDDPFALEDEFMEQERERLTFDAVGTFDEEAWAMREDRDGQRPPPSRVRVIVIPDAREETASSMTEEGA